MRAVTRWKRVPLADCKSALRDGVSDEISQVGEIEKVEAITELVEEVCGLAE